MGREGEGLLVFSVQFSAAFAEFVGGRGGFRVCGSRSHGSWRSYGIYGSGGSGGQ